MNKTKMIMAGLLLSLSANAADLTTTSLCEGAIDSMSFYNVKARVLTIKREPAILSNLIVTEKSMYIRFNDFCPDVMPASEFKEKKNSMVAQIKKHNSTLKTLVEKAKKNNSTLNLSGACSYLDYYMFDISHTVSLEKKHNKPQDHSKALEKTALSILIGSCHKYIDSDALSNYKDDFKKKNYAE